MFDKKYLEELIRNQLQEGPELEYKAAPALQREDKKIKEITKDVSAFANSNGGILIYGISEDPTNRNIPGAIDPIDRKSISKEWLEQIINSRIRPRIHGLVIHVITIEADQVVYLLEIPKGETAHQADDQRYYRRHNFMVEALLDHEIKDIMGRQKNAEIILEFTIRSERYYPHTEPPTLTRVYWLDIYAYNVGKVFAKYVNVSMTVPLKCLREGNRQREGEGLEEIQFRNTIRDLVSPDAARYYHGQYAQAPQFGPTRYEPILPGTRLLIHSLAIHEYATDDGNTFSWMIYADNAEPKSGHLRFDQVERI